jgi:hypothetical protein
MYMCELPKYSNKMMQCNAEQQQAKNLSIECYYTRCRYTVYIALADCGLSAFVYEKEKFDNNVTFTFLKCTF